MEARYDLGGIAEKKGISVREAAEAIGLSGKEIARVEAGKVRALRLSTVAAICEELDAAPEDFIILVR